MKRAPFQVLVLPYRIVEGVIEFAVFKRADLDCWQFVAGGGEEGEEPREAAIREVKEECGISADKVIALESVASIPVDFICERLWGDEVLMIREHCFAVSVENPKLMLSDEHLDYQWVTFGAAVKLLRWDSNRNALWELNERLKRRDV